MVILWLVTNHSLYCLADWKLGRGDQVYVSFLIHDRTGGVPNSISICFYVSRGITASSEGALHDKLSSKYVGNLSWMSLGGMQRGIGMSDRSAFRRQSLGQILVCSIWPSIKTNIIKTHSPKWHDKCCWHNSHLLCQKNKATKGKWSER